MTADTGSNRDFASDRPPPGGAIAVAPGVFWLRMPLPFQLDHINLWLIEDGAGWTLIDTGYDSAATRTLWEDAFTAVLGGRPITRVVCTHFHPDHMGLAGWLVDRFGASFRATLGEWLFGRVLSLEDAESAQRAAHPFYHRTGVPDDLLHALVKQANAYRKAVSPIPPIIKRLRDGDTFVTGAITWQVVIGRGHSPEHACLMAAEHGLFIAGDQVLPRISPNISVWPNEPDADPLADYLATLAQIQTLPRNLLVLPSHGLPFYGLHERAAELAAHHDDRLGETLAACTTASTAHQVMQTMFRRPLDHHQTRFAIGETVAHLNHLMRRGRIERRSGDDGVDVYQRTDTR